MMNMKYSVTHTAGGLQLDCFQMSSLIQQQLRKNRNINPLG